MHVVAQAPTQQDTLGLELQELSGRFDAKFIGVTIPGKDTPHGGSVRMSLQEVIAPMFGSAFDQGVGLLDADKILGGTKWKDLTDGEDTILHKHDIYGELATAETVSGQWTFTADILLTAAGTESIGSDAAGHVDIDAATWIDLNADVLVPNDPSSPFGVWSYGIHGIVDGSELVANTTDRRWAFNFPGASGYLFVGILGTHGVTHFNATTGLGGLFVGGPTELGTTWIDGNAILAADLTVRTPIFHVDAGGVGCGTLNPRVALHAYDSASGAGAYGPSHLVVFESDGSAAKNATFFIPSASGYAGFAWATQLDDFESAVSYSPSAALMRFYVTNVAVAYMSSTYLQMQGAIPVQFRDPQIYLASLADSALDIVADGAIRLTGTTLFNSQLFYSQTTCLLAADTADGSDSKRIQIAGGGDDSHARGAYAYWTGNEYGVASLLGNIVMVAGNTPGAHANDGSIVFYTGAAAERLRIFQDGDILVAGAGPLQFRDPQLYIYSAADSYLDIIADGCVRINTNSWFEADGTHVASGAATTFDDLLLPFEGAHVPAANNPTWTAWLGNVSAYTFAVNDYLGLQAMELMHTYLEDSNFEFHVHWSTNGVEGAAKYVKWEIEYSIANSATSGAVGDTFPATTVISAETEIPASTPDRKNMYTTFTPVTGTNFKVGAILKVRVRRIASAGAAPLAAPFGLMAGIHVEQDTDGSRTQRAK